LFAYFDYSTLKIRKMGVEDPIVQLVHRHLRQIATAGSELALAT